MIKLYISAIDSLYEGEDIEIRYSLFQDDVHIKKESLSLEYVKPAIVGLVSVLTLLQKFENYKDMDMILVLNDASLYEILRGSSTTRNIDVLKMASKTKKQLAMFKNISYVNVTKDKKALAEWTEILKS